MSREIKESPIGIGIDEIVPYTLTFPASWGTVSNPSAVAKDFEGAIVPGVVSAVSLTSSNVVSFTVTASPMAVDNDYQIEIKVNVSGGVLEAWGRWLCRT